MAWVAFIPLIWDWAKATWKWIKWVEKGISKTALKWSKVLSKTKNIHWNSLKSLKKTYLYDLKEVETKVHLKYWITSKPIPEKRYTNKFMEDKYMDIIDEWTRYDMHTLEHEKIISNPRWILQKNNH